MYILLIILAIILTVLVFCGCVYVLSMLIVLDDKLVIMSPLMLQLDHSLCRGLKPFAVEVIKQCVENMDMLEMTTLVVLTSLMYRY
jgi:hypothetical protein